MRKPPNIVVQALVFLAALGGVLGWSWRQLRSGSAGRGFSAVPCEAYVWQRAWTEGVRHAVVNADPRLSRLVVLAAEVSFGPAGPQVVEVQPDWASLRESRRIVGLAIRVGPFAGPFRADDWPAALLTGLAAGVLRQARQAGLDPAELQIDFDCPESRLVGYRVWVEAIRRQVAPTPLVITALPCWLDRPAFAQLVAVCDGFVLQVHSLARPDPSEDRPTLCDAAAARAAVERAGRLGTPFRVALATYSYVAAFDAGGKLLGLAAEGPAARWPQGARLRLVRAEPGDMAELVRAWSCDRPANLAGIIWYRLPVDIDRLNWRPCTLATVMSGRTPAPKLLVETRRCQPGLVEIDLVNAGTGDARPDVCVRVRWDGAGLLAADALGGFQPLGAGDGEFRLTGPKEPVAPTIQAGDRRTIGWVRLTADTEVHADVTPPS